MKAFLVYNGNAGGTAESDAEFYQNELREAGFSPVYRVTNSEAELEEVLPEVEGLLVVVGGDGTLRAVATRMVGRDIPIALIPAGTANNVGGALGVRGDPAKALRGLGTPRKLKMDLGVVHAPWGDSYFLEGAGFGLYAEALSRYRPQDGKSFLRGLKTLVELVSDDPAPRSRLRINGHEEEGEYLLVEAMNTTAIGPRMPIAGNADPSDGLLELVRVDASSRDSYLAYLHKLMTGDLASLESVTVDRVESFEFLWTGFPFHQDAEYREYTDYRQDGGIWLKVALLPSALEFWLPAEHELELLPQGELEAVS